MRTAIVVLALLLPATSVGGPGGGGGYIPERPRVCCSPTISRLVEARRQVRFWIAELSHDALAYEAHRTFHYTRDCFEPDAAGVIHIELDMNFFSVATQVRAWGFDDKTNDCVARGFDGVSFRPGWYNGDAGYHVRIAVWINDPDVARLRALRPWADARACASP